jgi:hypothetical protein
LGRRDSELERRYCSEALMDDGADMDVLRFMNG